MIIPKFICLTKSLSAYMTWLTSIRIYLEQRDYIIIFLLTISFLILSFASYSELSTTEINIPLENHSMTYKIHIIYYGFPFRMVGILSPLTDIEYFWVYHSGCGMIKILWNGLLLNATVFFAIAFMIVYGFRRVQASRKPSK
jgi:hypothetical protein